ncbi:unnamed protein product [Lampetra fluviatilis]
MSTLLLVEGAPIERAHPKSGNVDYYLLNTKSDRSPKLLLPAGDLDPQGLLDLKVIVCNPYGSCSSFPTPVHVKSNSRREVTSCVVGRNETGGHLDFIQENVFVAAEFLTPNMIDFTTVFTKFNLETNGAVFATVTIMVLLYIIVLLWARNQDARDAQKQQPPPAAHHTAPQKWWTPTAPQQHRPRWRGSRRVVSIACVMADSFPAPAMAAVDSTGGPSEAPSRSLCSSPLGKPSCGPPITVDDTTSDTCWRSTVQSESSCSSTHFQPSSAYCDEDAAAAPSVSGVVTSPAVVPVTGTMDPGIGRSWVPAPSSSEDATESLRSDGYLVELVNDAAKAADTLTYVKENSWLDSRTSALVTELTVFNANTNLLCHMNLLLVFSLTGENPTLGKLTTLDERLRVALALLVFVESLKALQLPLLHRGARRCLALPLLRRETRVKSRLLLLVVLLCACSLSLHGLYGARSWAHAFQSVTSALVRMSRLGEALGDGGACATLVYLSFRLLAIILVMSLGKWV